jgi:hypothetical protein
MNKRAASMVEKPAIKPKLQLIDSVILITLASTTLYLFPRNLPFILGSFAALWAPAALVMIFSLRPKSLILGPMRMITLYGIISVGILNYTLWKYMSNWNQIRILYEVYYLFVFTAIWSYYHTKRDFGKMALMSKLTFLFILFSLFTTNVALSLDPSIVRDSANNADFSSFQENIYNLTGAMDYSYMQAVICLIPILVYHIKVKQSLVFRPGILVIILVVIIMTEMRSRVFANIAVTLCISALSFIGSKSIRTSIVTISLMCILFVAIPGTFYAERLYELSTNFAPNSLMNRKISGFAEFIEDPGIDESNEVGSRAARYPLLFAALKAKPMFGHASYESNLNIGGGAHLYWMNRLTLWGIPGFIFFILVLYKIFKSVSRHFNNGYRFYYMLSIVSLIFLGLLKAIGGRELWLMIILVIPGLFYLPLLEKKTRNVVQSDKSKTFLINEAG